MIQPEINYLPEKGKIYDFFSLIVNSMKISDINQLYKDFDLSVDSEIIQSYKRLYISIQDKKIACLVYYFQ